MELAEKIHGKDIYTKWGADNSNFAERIERNMVKLEYDINKAIILGQPIEPILNSAIKSMSRLVETEAAFFNSQATYSMLKDNDVKRYRLVATIDAKTSDICREINNKIFKMSEYAPGVTAPPFHPHCRTVMVEE